MMRSFLRNQIVYSTLTTKSVLLASLACAVIFWPSPAFASVAFTFSGKVTSTFQDGLGVVPNGIVVDDPISGLISYDPNAADFNASPERGWYFDPSLSVSVNIRGSVFTQSSGQIRISNLSTSDVWKTVTDGSSIISGPGILDHTNGSFFRVIDQSAPFDLVPDDSLRAIFPPFVLSESTLGLGDIGSHSDSVDAFWRINYSIDNVGAVPEANTVLVWSLLTVGAVLRRFVVWQRCHTKAAAV